MNLSNLGLSRSPLHRRVVAGFAATVGACVVIGGLATGAGAADSTAWASPTRIVLSVGADQSQRVVSWYANNGDPDQIVQVAPSNKVRGGQFPSNALTFAGIVAKNTAVSAQTNTVKGATYHGHAVITGLKESTEYSYRVGEAGHWSQTYSFTTQKFDGDFDFLFFGDPQIGSSGDETLDSAGWQATLATALKANPKAELLVSGGDQVEHANYETEWDAFLAPDELREVPWVATIGNHDVGGKAYEQHFWVPNNSADAALYANGNPASDTSGGDYWFIYKDVLFIDLNSNSYATSQGGGGDAAHIAYVTDVINQQGSKAKYTVLVYHHSIYSPADHANDADNAVRRQDFPTAFSNLGVDLVLQGHDHSYSRSYEIKNGAKADPNEQPGQTTVTQGPGGVIYVTANSASGSKYYDLTAPDVTKNGGDYGPDPLNPQSHWANSVENQEHVRTYVKVSVDKGSLTVQNVVAGTCDAPNPAYERGNVKWCGPNQGAGAARPVGSLVDKVTIKIPSANGGHGSGFPGFPGKPWGLVSTPQSGKYTVTDLR